MIRPLGVLAPPDPEVARLKRRVTLASLAVALTLVALKLAASVMTGSVSILSSLVDSVSDSGASLVTLIAVRQAMRPADAHHRFGHGKAEPLAALGQALFVTGSALLLCVEAVRRLIEPEPVGEGPVAIAVMVFAIVATLLLVRYQDRVIARTQSLAVGADRLHYVGDLLINLGVILSILLSQYAGVTEADPVIVDFAWDGDTPRFTFRTGNDTTLAAAATLVLYDLAPGAEGKKPGYAAPLDGQHLQATPPVLTHTPTIIISY